MGNIKNISNCCFIFLLLVNLLFTVHILGELLSDKSSNDLPKIFKLPKKLKDVFAPSRSCYTFPITEQNRKKAWLTALAAPQLLPKKQIMEGTILPTLVIEKKETFEKDFESVKENSISASDASTIKKDLGRTALHKKVFYKNVNAMSTPKILKQLLEDVSKYKDIGYSQGMNFIGAFLLDHMQPDEALFAFAMMLDNPKLNLKQLFGELVSVQMQEMYVLLSLIKKYVPKSSSFIKKLSAEEAVMQMTPFVSPFIKLFVAELPYEVTSAIWDCLLRYGRKVLFAAFVYFCKKNEKLFQTSEMPFQAIYDTLKDVTPRGVNIMMKEIRKYSRRITDSEIQKYRKRAPQI